MTTDIEYGIIYLFPFVYPLNNKTFCECGAAGAALCAVTSTFVGAAKGAVIGAVTGALTGAATGAVQGAVEGYKETGTLEGTLRGMGKGAAKGAVQGAQDGLISGMVMGGVSAGISSMSGNPMFCFVAGTTVLTTLGKKAIETIQVGDTIPCVDHITGETAEKQVISTTVNKVNRLIELDIDGEIIQCTETHPFQVKGRGWVNASDLAPNDIVYTKNWNTATVKSVNLLELDEPVEVFNFEVEDCHTYFVGELSILVHDADCGSRGQLRKNMLKEGPAPGSNYQAHHGLPWEHKDYFGKAGLNVNDPKWGRWVKGGGNGGHQSWSKRYGNIWTTYKEAHPNPNADDIIDFFYKLNGGR